VSAPLDMLGRPIEVGSLIAKAMSAGSSRVMIQIYRVLEIIEVPRIRYQWTEERDETGKRIRIPEPWTDYRLKAQAVKGSGYSVPTKPSLLEALHSLLVLPQDFLEQE
jgi:hypothetical protein